MELNTNYNVSSGTGSPTSAASAAPSEAGTAGSAAQGTKFDGTSTLKGEIVDMNKESVTIKTADGNVVSGKLAVFPDAKIGDMVKFTANTNQNGEHTFYILSKTAAEAKNAMTLNALIAAELKPTPENMKLVNILLENNLPINKESLVALNSVMKHSGADELPKALFLLKNNVLPTAPMMDRLNGYINDSTKLSNQLEQLAKSIMEMPADAEKQKLLQLFTEILSSSGTEASMPEAGSPADATKASQNPALKADASADILLRQTAGGSSSPGSASSALPPASGSALDAAAGDGLAQLLKDTPIGTGFFRSVFEGIAEARQHMSDHPLPKEAQELIRANLEALREGLSPLIKDGSITKEQMTNLLKALPDGEKMLGLLDSEEKTKTFLLSLAERTDDLEEGIKTAATAKELIDTGAKKIAQRLSFSLDGALSEEKLEKVFDNLKDKLSQIAKSLDSGKDSDGIRQSMEDIKENLKFVDRLKNDPFVQIPLMLDQQQKQAELFVFSGKGGKNKKKLSQSALISLDLANLGHFETYIRRSDRSITCQFRLEDEAVSALVHSQIDKLDALLKEKGYHLDNISFVQIDEKFTLADDEPNAQDDGLSIDERLGRFSFDSRV